MRFFTSILATAGFVGNTLAVSHHCDGSIMCGADLNFVRDCDYAVNERLIRNGDINYGSPECVFHILPRSPPGMRNYISLTENTGAACLSLARAGIVAASSFAEARSAGSPETTCGRTTRTFGKRAVGNVASSGTTMVARWSLTTLLCVKWRLTGFRAVKWRSLFWLGDIL